MARLEPIAKRYPKMSEAKMGNKYCLGRVMSAETRAKISAARLGSAVTEETRAKHRAHRATAETRAKQSAATRGPLAHRWKGGVTPINELIRKSWEYKAWRTSVFERDNYTCQLCGVRGGELQADHIKPFSTHHELRLALSNGRTLCVPCHRATPTYARQITPKEQYAWT